MTTTSRREFLTTAAAAAPVAIPIAATAAEHDPVYAAIELHKQANALVFAVSDPAAQPSRDLLYAEWQRKDRKISEAEAEAADCMSATVPTTRAGLIALLSYVLSEHDRGNMIFDEDGLQELLRTALSALKLQS